MHFLNPVGEKKVVISEKNSITHIFLNDLEKGSREFFLDVEVLGENAEVQIVGRILAEEKSTKKWKVEVHMHGKNQKAELNFQGIADDDAKLWFDGAGILGKNSENGSLKVVEKIVLFSENAKAKALPVLRVETDNVLSASHAASVAPFSSEMLFFLHSRGIDTKDAKNLLKEGFLSLDSKNSRKNFS